MTPEPRTLEAPTLFEPRGWPLPGYPGWVEWDVDEGICWPLHYESAILVHGRAKRARQ